MYNSSTLNSDINRILGYLRHTDTICVSDCGLPVPNEVEQVDLALKFGIPTFLEVLDEILEHFSAERIILANEIKEKNPELLNELYSRFPGIQADFVPHEEFKRQTNDCKAIIRTGETHPYANIILVSSCIF